MAPVFFAGALAGAFAARADSAACPGAFVRAVFGGAFAGAAFAGVPALAGAAARVADAFAGGFAAARGFGGAFPAVF
ncbi:MAG TPA: hypothetical protein VE033_07325, partial [Acetobacteraceae bacterium]|nr:hypothetical protein [Acetobacteraceae bacterium]